jgi:hypothetical protein
MAVHRTHPAARRPGRSSYRTRPLLDRIQVPDHVLGGERLRQPLHAPRDLRGQVPAALYPRRTARGHAHLPARRLDPRRGHLVARADRLREADPVDRGLLEVFGIGGSLGPAGRPLQADDGGARYWLPARARSGCHRGRQGPLHRRRRPRPSATALYVGYLASLVVALVLPGVQYGDPFRARGGRAGPPRRPDRAGRPAGRARPARQGGLPGGRGEQYLPAMSSSSSSAARHDHRRQAADRRRVGRRRLSPRWASTSRTSYPPMVSNAPLGAEVRIRACTTATSPRT